MADSLKPGDKLVGDNGMEFMVGQMVAYQGKEDCTDVRCSHRYENGKLLPGCMGYHCAICHAPCSMMGHKKCLEKGAANA